VGDKDKDQIKRPNCMTTEQMKHADELMGNCERQLETLAGVSLIFPGDMVVHQSYRAPVVVTCGDDAVAIHVKDGKIEVFWNATIRKCIGCGIPVVGGPTWCGKCMDNG
jgi:hypothetical protein